MNDKHRPDSLKYQWRIVGLVTRSPWATGLDMAVAYEIVDNYRKDRGNSRASLSYLQKATGADRKSIIASTRRLVEHGPFRVSRQGQGTRPTEYAILFNLVVDEASSGAHTTTTANIASSGADTTPSSGSDATTSHASSGVEPTESVLPVSGLQAGIQDRMNKDCAPPSPPPGSPLGGATGADGHKKEKTKFDELWSAYGHRQARAAARVAYDKLAPDPDLHVEMIEAATAWRAHWERQGNPDAPRRTLAKWIETEGYHEDPPTGYKPKEKKVSAEKPAKPAPVASNDNTADEPEEELPAFMRGSAKLWPKGRHVLQVIDSSVEFCGGDTAAFFKFRILDGKLKGTEVEHRIYTECCVQAYQLEGRAILSRLITACDQAGIEDTSELHGLICAGQVFDGEVRYERLTEEESEEHAA